MERLNLSDFIFLEVFMMDFLDKIADLVNGKAEVSERDNRIYVEFVGIQKASMLKQFMAKHGFNYVYGAYDKGVYELGFAEGEGF